MTDPYSEADDFAAVRRRRWPLLALLVALAAAGFFGYRAIAVPAPLRVLLAIDLDGLWWEGSVAAAELADALARRLEKLGFEPVRAGDPEVTATLESADTPEDAARDLDASFLVSATLIPDIRELPIEGRYFEVRVSGPVSVKHIDAGPAPNLPEARVESWSGARKRDRALTLVGRAVADDLFDEVLPRLVRHPALADLFDGKGSSTLSNQIAPARTYLVDRDRKLRAAETAYPALVKRRKAQERGPVPVTYHGDPSADDKLCGTGPRRAAASGSHPLGWRPRGPREPCAL